jgi:hypothetical protein
MFVVVGTFYEVCAYIQGYSHASPDCPLSGEAWKDFNEFVCATYRFPQKYYWPYVIKQCSVDDDDATARLHRLLTEFAEKTKTQPRRKIAEDALAQAWGHEESEPVKAWRKFSRAIFRGKREDIEPLIQDHPDADILWSFSNSEDSEDVAAALDQIQERYLMRTISGSEKDGEVIIITPDLGPVQVKRIAGRWRVDASKLIERWKANRIGGQQPSGSDG